MNFIGWFWMVSFGAPVLVRPPLPVRRMIGEMNSSVDTLMFRSAPRSTFMVNLSNCISFIVDASVPIADVVSDPRAAPRIERAVDARFTAWPAPPLRASMRVTPLVPSRSNVP